MSRNHFVKACRAARDIFGKGSRTRVTIRPGRVTVDASDGSVWYRADIDWDHKLLASDNPAAESVFVADSRGLAKVAPKFSWWSVENIRVVGAEQLPEPIGPVPSSVELDYRTLRSVVFAAADRSLERFALEGVRIETDPETSLLTAVATDGHRVEFVPVGPPGLFAPVTVPKKACELAIDYLAGAPIVVEHGPDLVRLSSTHQGLTQTITTRPVNLSYPPWRMVVPDTEVASVSVRKDWLADAVERVGATADKGGVSVSISKERIVIHNRGPGYRAEWEAEGRDPEGTGTIDVDSVLVRDALDAIDDKEVRVHLTRDGRYLERCRANLKEAEEKGRHESILEEMRLRVRTEEADRKPTAFELRAGSWRCVIAPCVV